ncbi:hypothetical protein A2239_01995 [Candidatus Uhrbacteria bacterium RIFOXYA2_FULL_40_9]|nr:MAG: hypothetical protein A2239_01995 [Candidatus Uhrbacteria bacterium RIFOXYA2_FULL_40_9]
MYKFSLAFAKISKMYKYIFLNLFLKFPVLFFPKKRKKYKRKKQNNRKYFSTDFLSVCLAWFRQKIIT